MYRVTQPFDIDFVSSRFRAAVLAEPVGGLLPGEASPLSTGEMSRGG